MMNEKYCSVVRGYTLVELLIASAVLTSILAWGGPTMLGFVAAVKVRSGAQAMLDTLMLARSEAIKRNDRVVICKSFDGAACDADAGWGRGWIVFQDVNNNGFRDAGEPILHREQELPETLRMAGNSPVRNYVSYSAFGRTKLVSGAFQAGTFTVCSRTGGQVTGQHVIINSAGRPRLATASPQDCRQLA